MSPTCCDPLAVFHVRDADNYSFDHLRVVQDLPLNLERAKLVAAGGSTRRWARVNICADIHRAVNQCSFRLPARLDNVHAGSPNNGVRIKSGIVLGDISRLEEAWDSLITLSGRQAFSGH